MTRRLFPPGEKLLPDYFLDDAEDFQEAWLQKNKTASSSSSSSADQTAASSSSLSESPATLFAQVETMLNSDVVEQIKATYLFVVDGEHPGKHTNCASSLAGQTLRGGGGKRLTSGPRDYCAS